MATRDSIDAAPSLRSRMTSRQIRMLRCRSPGIEAVQADTAFAFGRHTHDQFGIGLIDRGAQKSASGRGPVEAGAGAVITVNPGEVHDGSPIGDQGRSWRILYLDPAIVAAAAGDIFEGSTASAVEIAHPVISDERLARLFHRLFRVMTAGANAASGMQRDEALLLVLGRLLRPQPDKRCGVPSGIALTRALIDDCPAAPLTLAELARAADLSRYHFLRAFARATGLTPHAYVMQRRVQRARSLIGGGASLAEAALGSGFSDQSHMTRLFVRSLGIAPGAYAKAMA